MTGIPVNNKTSREVRDLAEKELSGWEFDQTLLFHRNENYSTQEYPISYALAIDAEKLYPDQRSLSSDGIIWTGQCQAKEQSISAEPYCKSHLSKWKMGLWYLAIQMDTERKIMGISCIPF